MKILLSALLAAVCFPAWPVNFTSSDGVRLSYIEEGAGETLVFVPGWLMPAEIWRPQIDYFARKYRVVALDPRSQGSSELAGSGNHIQRRADDLNELIHHLRAKRVVLIGWSMGVIDTLMYVRKYGDDKVAALVLVDNSVGESPPQSGDPDIRYEKPRSWERDMATFVRSMFNTPQPPAYLDWLTQQVLRTPPQVSAGLLKVHTPGGSLRTTLYETRKPVFYAVTSSLRGQAETLSRKRQETAIEVFSGAGHALFVDQHARFNASLDEFLGMTLAGSTPVTTP